jgi:hypothetical protein
MEGTMAINPAFLQAALLKQSARNPLAGTFNTDKVTADQTGQAMKYGLASRAAYMGGRFKDAQIQNMADKLALERGYLGISEGRLGLAQSQLGLDTQRLGLSQQEESWREKNWRKNYDTESSNLWKTAALGLGTAGWSAYEGNRRAQALAADAAETRKWRNDQLAWMRNNEAPNRRFGDFTEY